MRTDLGTEKIGSFLLYTEKKNCFKPKGFKNRNDNLFQDLGTEGIGSFLLYRKNFFFRNADSAFFNRK